MIRYRVELLYIFKFITNRNFSKSNLDFNLMNDLIFICRYFKLGDASMFNYSFFLTNRGVYSHQLVNKLNLIGNRKYLEEIQLFNKAIKILQEVKEIYNTIRENNLSSYCKNIYLRKRFKW